MYTNWNTQAAPDDATSYKKLSEGLLITCIQKTFISRELTYNLYSFDGRLAHWGQRFQLALVGYHSEKKQFKNQIPISQLLHCWLAIGN